jgi:hypothetical protein
MIDRLDSREDDFFQIFCGWTPFIGAPAIPGQPGRKPKPNKKAGNVTCNEMVKPN